MQAKRKEASEHEARREKRRKVFRDRNIFSNARATFQPDPAANQAWSDAYNEVAIKWGRSARDALQRKREQLIAQGGVHQPMPDDQYTWEIVWNLITTDFHASRPTPQDQARFRVLHARIQSEKRYHNTLILPSFLRSASLGTMRPDTFCEALSQEITTQRLARVNQAWNDASAQAGSRRRRNLIRDRIALRHDVRAGFEPYGPLAAPPRRGVDRDAVAPTLPFDAQSALPGTWRYGAKLGSSAQGIASLWERVDAAGWVVDRVVAKETYMRQPGQWDAPRYWDGAVSQRVPLEFSIASYVGRSPEALHVVRHLSYGIYEQWPMYRMYMEFCPRGDLEDSIGKYASQNARKSGRDMDLVPVRACWAVFEALASVLCLMYVGGFPDEGGAMQRHAAVLHRDLKPANIFMSFPDRIFWRDIPIAKVGDFGHSIWTAEPSSTLPGHGTEGYLAPESHIYDANDPGHNHGHPVTRASDVWSVGRIMLSLLNQQHENLLPHHAKLGTPHRFQRWSLGVKPRYPRALCDLIDACLNPDPSARIGVSALWMAVHEQVAVGKGVRGRAMREEPLSDEDLGNMWFLGPYPGLAI